MNSVSDRKAPFAVTVDNVAEMEKVQMVRFEEGWPLGFNSPIPKPAVTMAIVEKYILVGYKDVYTVYLIYSRVLSLQQTRSNNLSDVLKYQLSPIPPSMFKDNREMRIATNKFELKKKLQVEVSSRLVGKVDSMIVDG